MKVVLREDKLPFPCALFLLVEILLLPRLGTGTGRAVANRRPLSVRAAFQEVVVCALIVAITVEMLGG
jgi:hypothetical protein